MMKEGLYYIGDLCYVMHDVWDEVCNLLDESQQTSGSIEGEFTLKDGRQFAIYNTQYGDGEYETDGDGNCCVDSGTIGCILKSDIRDNQYSEEQMRNLAVFVNMMEPFETGAEYDGDEKILSFGHFNIYT